MIAKKEEGGLYYELEDCRKQNKGGVMSIMSFQKVGSRRGSRISPERGFTLLETIIVVAIIGILTVASWPSIQNSLTIRGIDNAARDILTTIQLAKWQAVSSKYSHRVRFAQDSAGWTYRIEIEKPTGTWTLYKAGMVKRVPTDLSVTLTLPSDFSVIFDTGGYVSGFDSTKNVIAVSSSKLALLGEPSIRRVRFFASGSTQFIKAAS